MLNEQECIEVAEKVWGYTKQAVWGDDEGPTVWFPVGVTHETTNYLGYVTSSSYSFIAMVNSPDGMMRTLEAMEAKGWLWSIGHMADDYDAEVWKKGEPPNHTVFDADLPTAVHRAALAALRAQG